MRVAPMIVMILLIWLCAPGTHAQSSETPLDDPLQLEQVLQLAREVNPEVRAAAARVDAARARPSQAKALPNPRLTLGLRNVGESELSIGDDPGSWANVAFAQEIPFPGKRPLRAEAEERRADAVGAVRDLVELRVLSELKVAYCELSFVVESIAIVRKNRDVLEKFEKTAAARYEVGKGIQQDVLRSQVELSRLLERLATLAGRRDGIKARINELLNRPGDAPLPDPGRIERPALEWTYDELLQSARESSPELGASRYEIERGEKVVELARKEFYPDFVVAGGYFDRGSFDSIYQFDVGLRIPLYYRKKERFQLREAQSNLEAARYDERRTQESVEARLRDLYLRAEVAQQNALLYERGLLDQATLALESSVAAYEVGTIDFLTLLDNLLRLLNDEVTYYGQVTDVAVAIAQMEPLVDRSLLGTVAIGEKP